MHLVPILVVAYACLLPRELAITVLDAALFPYRLALILMAPFAIARLAQAPVRPSVIDFLVGFAAIWFVMSLLMTTSVEAGLVSGTANALDFGLAYLLGRASVRAPEDLRLTMWYLLPGILLLVLLLAAESLSHRILLRPMLANLLDLPDPYIFLQARFGLLRGMGPFPHPILGGVYLALFLPFAWYLSHNGWRRLVGCCAALGMIFTVSSTALIGVLIAGGFIVADIVQRLVRLPVVQIMMFVLGMLALAISIGSDSGLISFIIRNLTFDSSSGYYRQAIWEFGGAEALANPWFGIGQRDWARPQFMYSNSVDAYWLVLTMNHGFPALVAVLLAMIGTFVAVWRTQRFRHPADANVGKALMLFMVIVVVSGFTVHLWEAVYCWIIVIMGCGVSLAGQARQAPRPQWVIPPSTMVPAWDQGGTSRPAAAHN